MLRRSLASFGLGLVALAFMASTAFGQMPRPDTSKMLSASDVSQEEIQKVARIVVTAQMSTRAEQMKMRKEAAAMKKKMAQMDSTQKARVRRKFRKRQMAMRKKQMKVMQQQAKEEGMNPQMVRRIMRSAQRDSTLKKQLQTAMKAEMQKQMKGQMQGGQNPQNQ